MLGFCQDMYDNQLTVKTVAKKTAPEKTTPKKKANSSMKKKILIIHKAIAKQITTDNIMLKAMYHDQEMWRKDGWTPAVWRAGICVVPSYNKSKDDCTISMKPNYKINNRQAAGTIFNKALQHHG